MDIFGHTWVGYILTCAIAMGGGGGGGGKESLFMGGGGVMRGVGVYILWGIFGQMWGV